MRNFIKNPPYCNVWLVFAASLALMILAGTDYVFATIIVPLKEHLNYTQFEIQTVSSMRMLSNLVSLLTGLFHDRFGPRLTCTVGLILLLIGYSLLYMVCMKFFVVSYWVLGLFLMTISCGTFACYTSGLSTCLKNFDPKHRGKVVGVLLCVYGLTGGSFSAVFQFIFGGNLMHFIFFMLIFCGSVPVAGIVFLNVVPKKEMTSTLTDEQSRLLPNPNIQNQVDTSEATDPPTLEQADMEKKVEEVKTEVVNDNSLPTYHVIMTLDFWLLSLCVFCSMGSSVCLLSNIGSVVQSYGGDQSIVAILMIIYSVASSFGRILLGLLSDRLARWITRATFLNCCFLLIGACLFSFVFATVPFFYPLMFFFGIFYGGMMSTTPTFIGDKWGTKHFATNLAAVFLFQLLGSYLLSTVMASSIYQSHIRGGGKKCRGQACFQLTFIICTALSLVSFITCLVIMHRSKSLYPNKRVQK
jgi:OFA family oxalate/formate antiporter-like MFS transporter